MATNSSLDQQNQNQNTGGYVGEVNASLGGFDFSNMGASTSSATSSATSSLASGDKNTSSGSSSAGGLGSFKTAGLIAAAIIFYAIYAFSEGKGGK